MSGVKVEGSRLYHFQSARERATSGRLLWPVRPVGSLCLHTSRAGSGSVLEGSAQNESKNLDLHLHEQRIDGQELNDEAERNLIHLVVVGTVIHKDQKKNCET